MLDAVKQDGIVRDLTRSTLGLMIAIIGWLLWELLY
jgi:hypothetical protein